MVSPLAPYVGCVLKLPLTGLLGALPNIMVATQSHHGNQPFFFHTQHFAKSDIKNNEMKSLNEVIFKAFVLPEVRKKLVKIARLIYLVFSV
jgi:hypothetical protein